MKTAASSTSSSPGLARLISSLDQLGPAPHWQDIHRLLETTPLSWDDVAPYVEEDDRSYRRWSVHRTDAYELLVMTWKPGQESAAHDHAGSYCCLRVIKGRLVETLYERANDGLVDPQQKTTMNVGEVTSDPGRVIHSLHNTESDETLATVHVYSPPLPELRRYVIRPPAARKLDIFERTPVPNAQTVLIAGGGFCGTMVAANLMRLGSQRKHPLHIIIVDKQATFGEGAAYRTSDARHLLNVPAGRMSAWPDRPDDFFLWAQQRDPAVAPYDFLPRRLYGQYVRDIFLTEASAAAAWISAEIIKDEVVHASRSEEGSWHVGTASGRTLKAGAMVLATGHRPPEDITAHRWTGPRNRYIADPWSSLAITAIGKDEPVLVLGTGLTAVDVILSLSDSHRTAPIIAVSRRGLTPTIHTPSPVQPQNLTDVVNHLLSEAAGPLTARRLVKQVRQLATHTMSRGGDWRSVIDGLRAATPALWQALPPAERKRFLQHVRPFWEIHRHRMATKVGKTVQEMIDQGRLRILAGHVESFHATDATVQAKIRPRLSSDCQTLAVGAVINCTGPGITASAQHDSVVGSLIRAGELVTDELNLGVITGPNGEALTSSGQWNSSLIVIGTLRKPTLWESTAVPELRQQARDAAETILTALPTLAPAAEA